VRALKQFSSSSEDNINGLKGRRRIGDVDGDDDEKERCRRARWRRRGTRRVGVVMRATAKSLSGVSGIISESPISACRAAAKARTRREIQLIN